MVETKEAVAKPLAKEKAEGEKGEEQVEEETKEVEEPIEESTPTEQIEEEAVEEVKEFAPEAPEEKTEIAEEVKKEAVVRPWRKRRRRGSRAVSGVTKEDFMEFARKYYPSLVEEFEAKRIPFEELKTRVERDVGLVWVDLK